MSAQRDKNKIYLRTTLLNRFGHEVLLNVRCVQCASLALALSHCEAEITSKKIENKHLENIISGLVRKYEHHSTVEEIDMLSTFRSMEQEILQTLESAKREHLQVDCKHKDTLAELASLKAAIATEAMRSVEEIVQLRISGNSYLQQLKDARMKVTEGQKATEKMRELQSENSKLLRTIENLTDIVNTNMEYNKMEEEGTLPEKEDCTCYGWSGKLLKQEAKNTSDRSVLKEIQPDGSSNQVLQPGTSLLLRWVSTTSAWSLKL